MKISKSNIGSIKDLILAEITHDVLKLPGKNGGGQPPLDPSSTALSDSRREHDIHCKAETAATYFSAVLEPKDKSMNQGFYLINLLDIYLV